MNMFKSISNFFSKAPSNNSIDGNIEILTPGKVNYKKLSTQNLIRANKYWIYCSATKNANTVSSVPLKLYATTSRNESKPIVEYRNLENHEIKSLKRISRKANQYTDSNISIQQIYQHPVLDLLESKNIQELLFLIDYYLELTGNSYLYIIRNRVGIPIDVQLIPSQLVTPCVKEDNSIYYEINVYNKLEISSNDIIHFKFPNPENPITGLAPLSSIIQSQELYQSMIDFEFALNNNSAIPSMIVKYINGELSRDDKLKLETEWNKALRGISKSGKIKVTDENFEVQKLGIDPKDMQYLEGKKWIREEIAAAFGVPLSLLTTTDVNLANAETGFRTYREFTIVPRLQLIAETLNSQLLINYKSKNRLFLAFDDIIGENWIFKLQEVTQLFNAGIISQDEARSMYQIDNSKE